MTGAGLRLALPSSRSRQDIDGPGRDPGVAAGRQGTRRAGIDVDNSSGVDARVTRRLSAADADGSRAMINWGLVRLKLAGVVMPPDRAARVRPVPGSSEGPKNQEQSRPSGRLSAIRRERTGRHVPCDRIHAAVNRAADRSFEVDIVPLSRSLVLLHGRRPSVEGQRRRRCQPPRPVRYRSPGDVDVHPSMSAVSPRR